MFLGIHRSWSSEIVTMDVSFVTVRVKGTLAKIAIMVIFPVPIVP